MSGTASRTESVPRPELLKELERALAEGKEVVFKPSGRSMLPFIREGDGVALRRGPLLRPGSVVLARCEDGRLVLHRILKIKCSELTLMGDGNLRGREKARRQSVLGVAVAVEREGRRLPLPRRRLWVWLLPLRRPLLALWKATRK